MKYLILGMMTGLVIGYYAGYQDKSGWTTYVRDDGSSHLIKAPFANKYNICTAVVLNDHIGVHCQRYHQ